MYNFSLVYKLLLVELIINNTQVTHRHFEINMNDIYFIK